MPVVPTPRPTAANGTPPVGPNPAHRRLWLGLKLLLVPMAIVCLPTLFVTYFFGQRPTPKPPAPDAAFSALRDSLERAARDKLPEGTPTFGTRFEDLSLPGAPADSDALVEKLRTLATDDGGTVTDQGNDAGGRHLLVELPAAHLTHFRQRATHPEAPVPSPTPDPGGDAGQVFLRVTLPASPPATP